MIHVKINEAVKVTYQAPKAETGLLDVTMEIVDETGAKDVVNFPDVTMTETPAASGRYVGSFTPDALGLWTVHVSYDAGKGPVTLSYLVHTFDQDDAAQTDPPLIV